MVNKQITSLTPNRSLDCDGFNHKYSTFIPNTHHKCFKKPCLHAIFISFPLTYPLFLISLHCFQSIPSIGFSLTPCLPRADCNEHSLGMAGYVETQMEAWCRKKRWQELKRSNNVRIIFLFRSNDRFGFKSCVFNCHTINKRNCLLVYTYILYIGIQYWL